jgi:hypothetical protein
MAKKTAAAAPAASATVHDVREFALGFLDPCVPGTPRMKRKAARKIADKYADDLVEALRAGRPSPMPPRNCATAVNVISRPQIIFRCERLVVPSGTAEHFSILDLRVGNRSQLIESTELPAQAFAENAMGVRLSFDTASIAQDIVLSVRNETREDRAFRAVMFGRGSF